MEVGSKEYHAYHSRKCYQKKRNDPIWYAENKHKRTLARRKKKAKYVAKFGGECLDCKGKFPDPVFEFHHLDPTTKMHHDNAKIFMFSDKRIEEELSKCVMLCANCHRIRHYKENS